MDTYIIIRYVHVYVRNYVRRGGSSSAPRGGGMNGGWGGVGVGVGVCVCVGGGWTVELKLNIEKKE